MCVLYMYTYMAAEGKSEVTPHWILDVAVNCRLQQIFIYVHTKINEDAFPNAIKLYDKNKMTGRGHGKYGYKEKERIEAEIILREQMNKYFPQNKIEYIV